MTTQTLNAVRFPLRVRALTEFSDRISGVVEGIARRIAVPFTRFALAIVMLWFGVPKRIPGGVLRKTSQ